MTRLVPVLLLLGIGAIGLLLLKRDRGRLDGPARAPTGPSTASPAPTPAPYGPGGLVVGELELRDGSPGAGRSVELYSLDAPDHPASGTTDPSGGFRFEHVAPGAYDVVATSEWGPGWRIPPNARPALDEELEGALQETRGAHSLWRRVEVVEGGTAHASLGPTPPDKLRLGGVVRRAGSPVPGVAVWAVPTDPVRMWASLHGSAGADPDAGPRRWWAPLTEPFEPRAVICGARGRFETWLDGPGDYVLRVESMGVRGAVTMVHVPAADPAADLVLDIPSGRVEGCIRGPDGPVVGVTVQLASVDRSIERAVDGRNLERRGRVLRAHGTRGRALLDPRGRLGRHRPAVGDGREDGRPERSAGARLARLRAPAGDRPAG